ncbi:MULTISPECIES: hypothetical protein [unclassified Caballeronia]|uniref:hypothetical protein n=1 Tax=unclassified Caballeronia TaxID=2646786 RepID=UPI0020285B88|nr:MULTISPECIES: hypothetical protein [unclassified Caballeronia]
MKTRAKKTVIGTTKCLCCEREIPAKQNEHGTLDVSCQWCDMPVYAKEGTEAKRKLMERVTLILNEKPAAPVETPPSLVLPMEQKPAARAARTFFDLSGGAR